MWASSVELENFKIFGFALLRWRAATCGELTPVAMHWLLQVVLLVTSVRSISFVGAQTCNAEAVDTCGRQRRRLPATGNGTESVPQTRIVNGAEVCPNFPYPHVVSLLMPSEVSGNSYIPTDDTQSFTVCGGTLVNRTHVITAAHCVDYNEYNLAGLAVDVSGGQLSHFPMKSLALFHCE